MAQSPIPGSQGRPPVDPDAVTGADSRIAPDPFVVVLPALSALGAITCIASVNWVAQDKTPERSKSRRKPATALRDLESCCLGLQEIFKRFQRYPNLFAGAAGATAPMKFGVHGPRIAPDEVRLFHQLMNDTASMLVLAAQNAFDVMAAVEDGELNPPDEVFYGFAEAQEELNQLMQQRASLKPAVDAGAQIAAKLTRLVREIKSLQSG